MALERGPGPREDVARGAHGRWHTVRLGSAASFRIDRRAVPVMGVLLLAFVAVALLSVGYGEYRIAPLDVLRAIVGSGAAQEDHTLVVRLFRLPRLLLAALVGGALALSGAILQGITRNALAEPGILGISNGAALTAVAFLVGFDQAPTALLPWAAFAGALVTAALIYLFAWKGGSSPLRLILIGIGFAAVAQALTTLMVVWGQIDQVQQAYIWLSGSVYGRGWEHVRTVAVWLAILGPLALLNARQLNTLALGDETATGLGLRIEIQRGLLVLISVALAAGAVAAAGTIGFVGLVAPHVTRRLVGVGHEGLLPATFLTGALLVVLADFVGRTVIAPNQLPAGIVTALVGAPYFMYLLWRYRDR
jgi:iron complex transport system permease protein